MMHLIVQSINKEKLLPLTTADQLCICLYNYVSVHFVYYNITQMKKKDNFHNSCC